MKKYNKILGKILPVFLLASTISVNLIAQTGPGGVGNSDGSNGEPEIKLWLLTDSLGLAEGNDVLSWTDYSGNNNDLLAAVATSPIFRAAAINSHDYLEFSKANNRIIRNSFDMPTDAVAVFMVVKTTDSGDGVLSYAVAGSDNEYLFHQSNSLTTHISGSNDNSGVSYNDNSWKIFGHQWRSSDGRLYIHIDGTEEDNTTFQPGATITTGGNIAIGGEQDGVNSGYDAGQAFQGDIAEFILFGSSLKQADRVVIENYLAQKYGLDANLPQDCYVPDDASYIVALTGMGKEFDGTTESFCDGLVITQNGGFDNGEYIFSAYDGAVNSINKTPGDVLYADIEARWQRDWYIDKTGIVNAKIAFDFSDGINGDYPANIENYRLLYKANIGDSYDTVNVAGKGIQNGDQLYFALGNADLLDGFYGLASVDTTNSPLDGTTGRKWYTLISGDWDNWEIWTLDPSGSLPNNPDHLTPTTSLTSAADEVHILTGKTVTVTSNNKANSIITVDGRLDIGNSSLHSFGEIKGTGRILLSSDNFPSGDATDFITAGQGEGTVEYYGTSFDLIDPREFFDVEINLDDPNQTLTLLNDYLINGDLRITQGELQINDNSTTTNLNITVNGELGIETNGKILTGTGNARHQLNIYGDFINDGIAKFTQRVAANYNSEATDGIVDINFLSDNSDQRIYCNGTTNFYRIEIDKGTDATYVLTIETSNAANFNLFGYASEGHGAVAQLTDNANALGLIKGTVKIKSNISIPVLSNGSNYNVSEAACLWVDGGIVQKNSGNSLVPYGKIRLSSGTLEAKVGSGITTRENGLIKIEGGTLNTDQIRTSVLGASNVGGYVQSGGTVNILGTGTNGYYHFCLTYPGNVFNMSGGTLHVYGANDDNTTEGGIFINSDPENINVSGGTVIAEINNSNNFRIVSKATFYNLILRNTFNTTSDHILSDAVNVGSTNENLAAQPLVVLNDLTIEDNCFLNHNGENVTIGRNFSVEENSQQQGTNNRGYLYDASNPNITKFNGSEDGVIYIGESRVDNGYELYFTDLTIDKPTGKSVLLTGDPEKEAANVTTLYFARLIQVTDDFILESGTFNQGEHAVRLFGTVEIKAEGTLGVYTPAVTQTNASFVFRGDGLTVQSEEGAKIGNFKMDVATAGTHEISFTSDMVITRMGYTDGKINLGTHNLRIDYLHDGYSIDSLRNDDPGIVSSGGAFYTAGNSSDGGLSILVDGNGTSYFPVGVSGKYTPAEVAVSNYSDDGYVTVNPVDHYLWTLTSPSGASKVLDYYWSVNKEDFLTSPDVYWTFNYNSGDVNGSENSYQSARIVNYKIIEELGNWSVNAGADEMYYADDANPHNPITLTAGDYTAGNPSEFNSSIRTLYARKNGEWHDPNTWSTAPDGSSPLNNKNQLPEAGDICVIGSSTTNYAVAVSSTNANYEPIDIAMLAILRYGGGESSLVTIGQNGAECNFGVVTNRDPDAADPESTANHASKIIISGPDLPSGDFGEFLTAPNTIWTYSRAFPGSNALIDDESGGNLGTVYSGSYKIGNSITEYPILQFEYDGYSGGYIELPDVDITVNSDFRMFKNDHHIIFSDAANGDLTVKGDFEFNEGGTFNIEFQATGTARKLTVEGDINFDNEPNTQFSVENAASSLVHTLKLQGDLINPTASSDFNCDNGSGNATVNLEFYGDGNSDFADMTTIPDFNQLIMNKGTDQTYVTTVNSQLSLGSDASSTADLKPILLQNGTLQLNHSSSLDISTGGDEFEIPSTACLEVQQGQVNVNGGSGILLDGKLHLTGGTVDMSGGDNYIQYSASGNATIDVESGNLTVGSQIRRGLTSTEGILNYNQTGGTVIVGNNTAPENNRGVFEILNDGSSFNHAGGDLYIARSQTNPSFASLYLDPEFFTFGEGTELRLGYSNTPANQTISIYSTIDIANLVVDASSATPPTAQQWVVTLTVSDSLEIESGATFDANGLNLVLNGDLIVDGTFTHNNNITYFSGSGSQQIVGTPAFWNLTKDASSTLTLNSNITVSNELRHEDGTIDDNGNALFVKGDVYFDGDHTWGGSGDGILLNGTEQQNLECSGTFGKLSINNSSGIYVPIGNTVKINNALQLENGVLDIGKNLLELDNDAIIIEKNAFSENNMIQTNISFTDAGVKKYYPAVAPSDNYSFIYPVGSEGKYTPVEFVIDTINAGGAIRVKGANEIHPTIINDLESCSQIEDSLNVLKYHWLLEANSIQGFTADASMKYYPEDYQVPQAPYDVSAYIAARLLLGSNQWNKYDQASFDETNELLLFSFANTDDDGISGDYTAGVEDPAGNCEGAIPDEVPAYITISDGDWTNAAIWQSYPTPGEYPVPSGGPRGAIAIVQNEVTIPSNYILSYKTLINATGIVKIGTTFGHRLGIVEGTGMLQSERGSLPAGIYDNFFGRNGGTVEFTGNTDYDVLSEVTNVRNLKFSGTGKRRLPNLNFEVYGLFTIDGDDATLQVINEHDQNLTLDSNVVYNQGSFDAGLGTSTIIFNGTNTQTISGTGSFTGTNAFRNIEIDNSNGVTLSSPAEIKGTLAFTSGVITTDATNILSINNSSETAVTGYSSSNYVDGPMRKLVNSGGDFVFPVGDAGRYGPINIYNTTNGSVAYWEAQYFNSGHASSGITGSLVGVSTTEYWYIDNPTAGDAAEVELRWDSSSDITPITTGDINEIVVAEFNGTNWEDKASDAPSGGDYAGTVKTTAAINIDPLFYTLGSTTTILAQAYFTTLDDVCEGNTISVSFSGVDASNLDYSLTYEVDGTPTTVAITSLPYSITASAAGTYVLTDFSYNNPPGHAGPSVAGSVNGSSVTVNAAPAQPTISAVGEPGSLTFCSGGSVILTSSAGTGYLWSTGATTANINVNTTGNYTVQISDANGCYSIASAPKTVTVNALPVFTPSAVPASICFGETSQLDANFNDGSTTYVWTPVGELDNSGIENPVYTPATNPTSPLQVTTTFTVTVTDSNSCSDVETVGVTLTRTPDTGPQYHLSNDRNK